MHLPPLNALRAFEAAARHNGYIAAAEELCVTRGAISRHVKLLEQHLGVALFHRGHKGVDLTVAGRDLQKVLSDAFGKISAESDRITAGASDLRIICPPTLSIRWLFPRLGAFRQLHPEIRVRLTTEFYGDRGFDPTEYDLGISFERWPGRRPDIPVEPLFPMLLSPACAPTLTTGDRPLATPEDIRRFTLLHESPDRTDWSAWASTFGVEGLEPGGGEVFPNLDMATRAAVMGSGIVMADLVLCREEIDRGALVLPFPDMTCTTPAGRFALIGAPGRWQDPQVRTFRTWVSGIARDAERSLAGHPG